MYQAVFDFPTQDIMTWHERWRLDRAYESEAVNDAAPEIPDWSLWMSDRFNMYYLDSWIVI